MKKEKQGYEDMRDSLAQLGEEDRTAFYQGARKLGIKQELIVNEERKVVARTKKKRKTNMVLVPDDDGVAPASVPAEKKEVAAEVPAGEEGLVQTKEECLIATNDVMDDWLAELTAADEEMAAEPTAENVAVSTPEDLPTEPTAADEEMAAEPGAYVNVESEVFTPPHSPTALTAADVELAAEFPSAVENIYKRNLKTLQEILRPSSPLEEEENAGKPNLEEEELLGPSYPLEEEAGKPKEPWWHAWDAWTAWDAWDEWDAWGGHCWQEEPRSSSSSSWDPQPPPQRNWQEWDNRTWKNPHQKLRTEAAVQRRDEAWSKKQHEAHFVFAQPWGGPWGDLRGWGLEVGELIVQ